MPQSTREHRPLAMWILALILTVMGGCASLRKPTQNRHADRTAKIPPSVAPAVTETPPPQALPEISILTPFVIALGPDGNLWFTELRRSQIGRITPSAQISTYDLGSGTMADRLAAGPDDSIWFTDPAGNRIGRLGLDGTTAYIPLETPESGPAGIVKASDGNLWFTEHAVNRVGRVTPLGTLTEFVLPHGGSPAGIAEGSDGKLYVAENSGDRIDRISMNGQVQEFLLPTPGSRPDSIVRGADGAVWFTEFGADKIGRLTPSGQIKEYSLAAHEIPGRTR